MILGKMTFWAIHLLTLMLLTVLSHSLVHSKVSSDFEDFGPSKLQRSSRMRSIQSSIDGLDEVQDIKLAPEVYKVDDTPPDFTYYYYSAEIAKKSPPPCIHNKSDAVFLDGYFSVEQTFYNCLENVLGSSFIPTFWNGSYHGQLPIYTSMIMNSLVGVIEEDSTVELTFDLTMEWKDERFYMPGIWEKIPMGFIDLTSTILQNSSINIWRPNIVFPDATLIDIFAFDFRLNRNSFFYYQVSYHMILVQPGFNFASYPADQQTISIRFADAEFEVRELLFIPTDMEFTKLDNGAYGFDSNPIWDYESYSFTSYVDPTYDNSYNVYEINVVRRAYGVVIRLVLPMALLIVLGSITFWVSYDHRVDVTITILLAMSALYIVILQNIPLVGYLTNVDRFVFWMYFMLVLITILHQTYATLNEKLDRWPLRLIYLRLIELCGRVFVLPAVVIYFVEYIPISNSPAFAASLMLFVIIVAIVVFLRELFGIRSNFYDAMRNLSEKCNAPDLRVSDLSWVEAMVMNLFYFKTLSISKFLISDYLQKNGAFPVKVQKPLHLKNLSSLVSLLQGQHKAEQGKSNGKRSSTGLPLLRILQTSPTSLFHSEAKAKSATAANLPRRKGWEMFLNGELESGGYTEDDFQLVQNELLHSSNTLHTLPPQPQQQQQQPQNETLEMEMTSRLATSRSSVSSSSYSQSKKHRQTHRIDSDDEEG